MSKEDLVTPALLTDNPVQDSTGDEFGFLDHATLLCDAIMSSADLPLTLAVLGPWGSGKSSFLNICRDLMDAEGAATVSFSPWKYDRRDEVWHALLQTLLNELVRTASRSVEPRVRDRVRTTLARVARLSASATWLVARQLVTTATGSLVSAEDLDSIKQQAQKEFGDPEEQPMPGDAYGWLNRFEKDFSEVVRALTGDRPLIVFIDDLDRCRRATALSVLEALRIFMGDAPCVFVVAMDQNSLIDAAATQFDGDRTRGRWYLEKLVNFSYHLPAVRYESLVNSLRAHLDFLPDDPVLWEVIRVSFENNPRRVRRFVSSFNLTLAMLGRTGAQSPERMRQVAILLMLRQEHPECFAALSDDPGVWERLAHLPVGADGAVAPTRAVDRELVDRDRRLLTTLRAIASPASGFVFPPPPSPDLLTLLTDVLVIGPISAPGEEA
jgi:KAP family P-loop domain